MNTALVTHIKIISQTQSYWDTIDPVIPLGKAGHVSDGTRTSVRIGNGSSKFSELPVTNIYTGLPVLASDAEVEEGTTKHKSPSVKQVKDMLGDLSGTTISSAGPSGEYPDGHMWIQYI